MERHWSLGDFSVREIDQDGADVEHAKPIGYYRRGSQPLNGAGVGGFYGDLLASNRTVEDGSYTKLREVRIAFELGNVPAISGRWTIALSGRNLYTWTKYSGWDPERASLAVGLTRPPSRPAACSSTRPLVRSRCS